MSGKMTLAERLFEAANLLFLAVLSFASVYPVIYVLISSVSSPDLLLQSRGFLFFPQGFQLDAYKVVFQNPNLGQAYFNTLFYVVAGTLLNVFFTSLAAYALSRQNVMWSNPAMMLIVFTMFFSGGLIPNYLLMGELGLLNTRWAILFPGLISTYNLIIMRTSFQGIPVSLEESARIDGASDFTILFRIILPLSMPVVAVMILFYGVTHWNAWFNAFIYLRDRGLQPLQLLLREVLIQNNTDSMMTGVGSGDKMPIGETIKYAMIAVSTIPILILYPFLQKYFVKGVMIGAVKG
ncbi:carbohydrate ABC transporter permease [Paenibacillus sp. GCM10027626]|uniref:carbohydrate ABC transporter permease n=1 Tax=Paenibacillus sp. GCM10027626 TaxID=3273411 RepID=UPI0036419054